MLQSSPTIYNGVIYIGSQTGMFFAVSEATGTLVWKRQFPWITATTCGSEGFVSTATVAPDPNTGVVTVYVAAPDGYLYALNASDGSTIWRSVVAIPSTTVNDYFNWGSPTVANGKIYMGISSQCDNPLVQGGVKAYDQSTGTNIATYYTVPSSNPGGSVWSSQAVDSAGNVYATTGNQPKTGQVGDTYSIVKLDGTTLAVLGRFQITKAKLPGSDDDFGGSPTLFTAMLNGVATPMVGACNKNGVYYAVKQSDMSLVWSDQLSVAFPNDKAGGPGQCDAAATWDGTYLYQGTNSTTINGTTYPGSVRALDPATGAIVWETGLPSQVIGSTTLNGSGVLAAPLMGSATSEGVALLNASDGTLLRVLNPGSQYFAQPVWADGHLILAGQKRSYGLQSWS
jgi:polyvinyl alcohol dehydrogenase (cytochrome)